MNLHVFVAMPFGTKQKIDFDKVYADLIEPALTAEGFEVFRADKAMQAGEIRSDMFQELLLADLVVVDISIDNPNVWYELGVRHALRSRGVIQIRCNSKRKLAFDVSTDRTLSYHIKSGVPDPAKLESDKKLLAQFAVETCKSWHRARISPVYKLLPYLQEPDWKTLHVKEFGEHWDRQKQWEQRIEVARKKGRPGDILVLADEAPTYALLQEAYVAAGKALQQMGEFSFALEQFEKALAINPDNLEARQRKGIVLGRLHRHEEAKVHLNALVDDHPNAENLGLLGRAEKDAWTHVWRKEGATQKVMIREAAAEAGLLREAIKTYTKGFILEPSHLYSAINAVTLHHIHGHLTSSGAGTAEGREMEGGIRWAIRSALAKDARDYWAKVTLGDLELLVSDKPVVERAYQEAVALAVDDWFALDSSRQQLHLLQDLGLRPENVAAGLQIFDRALERLKAPWAPRQVLLFSGHMIDAPGRAEPRFPADKEDIATEAIAKKLDEVGAGENDLALCGGACGGDLIFAEQCLQRGLRLQIRISFEEPEFLEKSVNFAGERWRDRFYKVKKHKNTDVFVMPSELGPTSKNANPYERNNVWQLYSALAWGAEKVSFIALWNGKEGDGRGGTKHMLETVRKRSGHDIVINTTELW